MEHNGQHRRQKATLQERQASLEALMREYGDDVLRMAYLYVKDIHIAEDMFQETFLKAGENLDTFEGRSSAKTWLLSIAINTCRDYLKSAYHRRVVPMFDYVGEQPDGGNDFERLERVEEAGTVRDAVLALPEAFREVVLCVYFREMSMEETARELGISVGTVKSRLSRAKEKLKIVLERRLSDE